MVHYTTTLSGTIDGTPSTIVIRCLELDPVPVIESKHYEDIGQGLHHDVVMRYKYNLKCGVYRTIEITGEDTTEEYMAIAAFIKGAASGTLKIESSTLPRWSDATNFPTLNARLPISVVPTGMTTSLSAQNAWNTLVIELTETGVE